MRAPIEEYKRCPYCEKRLGWIMMRRRLKKEAVKCFWCKKIIMPDMKVY